MTQWHEDDALWSDLAPAIFTQERMGQAGQEVEHILALSGLTPGSTVLDLACGLGRHSLEFAKHGCRVTGVDRTAAYLDRARVQAIEQNLDIEWVQADMREFRRDRTFDAVVNLLTSFGYFDDPADDRRVLENIVASLKPDGVLVIEMMVKEVLARIFRERDWHEEPDGAILLEHRRITRDWSRLEVRWIVLQGEERREHRFSLRLFSGAELQAMLREVGFAIIEAYGSLAGIPFDHQAQRLVLLARKR